MIALNKPLAKAAEKSTCIEQRGFVEGRVLVDNVLEMDTYGRICSVTASSSWQKSAKLTDQGMLPLPAMAF